MTFDCTVNIPLKRIRYNYYTNKPVTYFDKMFRLICSKKVKITSTEENIDKTTVLH